METMCPLCGRKRDDHGWEEKIPKDVVEIENQIENLDRVLGDLNAQQESLLALIDNRVEMCPMCQDLMEDITDEADRHDLEQRINKQVEELEEIIQDKLPGQL